MATIDDLRTSPRFEVYIAPQRYDHNALNVDQSLHAIGISSVDGRGWAFPHFDERSIIIGPGEKYIGGEIDYITFVHHLEEWRLYPSGQFLFRRVPWEILEDQWQQKTRAHLESRGRKLSPDVIGFIAYELLLFSVTEAYIFASRFAQAVPYDTAATIHVGLKGVKGYAIAAREPSRSLSDVYLCPIDDPYHEATLALDALVADPKAAAATALVRLYRQFRWTPPPSTQTIAQRQLEYYR